MKILVASVTSLFLGLMFGLCIGRVHAKREMTEAVQQMLQTVESSAGAEAGRDARAIGLIQGGETQQAVHLLCTPIAYYYDIYENDIVKDERRSRVRALIEELVRTNTIVAEEMTNHRTRYELKGGN